MSDKMAHVGRCPGCNRVVAVTCVDDMKRLAETLREWAGYGLVLDIMPVEQARTEFSECVCQQCMVLESER